MKKNLVCGIGNALVDSEYKVLDKDLDNLNLNKGCMELNDSSNHLKLTNELKSTHGVVKMMPGGSVANSLYTLAQFNEDVSFIGKVSKDKVGDNFIKSLDDIQIRTSIKQVDYGISGECVVLITPDHERTMYTHLGVSAELNKDDVNTDSIINSQYLLVEGYLVTSDETTNVADFCLEIADNNNVKKIITLSDPNVVNIFRENMMRLIRKKFDILFCNKQEALNISESKNIESAMNFLKEYSDEVIITSGDEGAFVSDNKNIIHIKSENVEPVDLTGAGDMFLAAYMYAMIKNKNKTDRIRFANICSSHIIQKYGAKLDSDNHYKMLMNKL